MATRSALNDRWSQAQDSTTVPSPALAMPDKIKELQLKAKKLAEKGRAVEKTLETLQKALAETAKDVAKEEAKVKK